MIASPERRPAARADLPPAPAAIHLVGVGGAGMRGLAVVLADAGYAVSGCDRGGTDGLDDLAAAGIAVAGEHDPAHATAADLLVRSSAVPPDAPEVAAALERGVPVLRRARALGALLNGRELLGVAGTHGKTTITAMAGLAAETAGLDPLVLVGGRVTAWGGFARAGSGPAIVEADEYDRSFLDLDPTLAVVSSLEPEHLDTYGDLERLRAAYREFAARAGDAVVYCADDPGARELAASMGGGRSYGFATDAWCRIEPGPGTPCRLSWPDGTLELRLAVPGRHNRQNAAAAFCAVLELGGEVGAIGRGLEAFRGVGRRLETLAAAAGLTIIDDYAHHPTEVAASLAAVRDAYPEARLGVVFQPHLYSRTRDFAPAFAEALSAADEAWVLPIYPAREAPIEGVSSRSIVEAAEGPVREIDRAGAVELAETGDGDRVLVFMGAGDITRLAREVAERWTGDAVGA